MCTAQLVPANPVNSNRKPVPLESAKLGDISEYGPADSNEMLPLLVLIRDELYNSTGLPNINANADVV